MNHPDASLFEQYVIGGLSAAEEGALERHTLACEGCAEQLQREAQLETKLDEAFTRLGAPVKEERKRPALWLWPVLTLGLTASVVCLIWLGRTPPRTAMQPFGLLRSSPARDLPGSRIDAIALDGIDDRMNTVDILESPLEDVRGAPPAARE